MSDTKRLRRTSIPALGLLTWGPMAGYEVKARIESSLGNFWSESYGQLYPQLAALEDEGLIEVDPDAESDGRGKKVYRITEAGRRHLAGWLDLAPQSRPPRNELLLKIFFGAEGDAARIAAHVRASREETTAALARYRGIEKELRAMTAETSKARFWLMTVRNGIRHAETHLEWCDETLTELEEISDDQT